MQIQNIYSNIPENLDQEIFERLAGNSGVVIEKIISNGQRSPQSGWYDQETNEWVLVLEGKAELAFKDQETVILNKGDFINIPAHKKHKVNWTDSENVTIWLVVHY